MAGHKIAKADRGPLPPKLAAWHAARDAERAEQEATKPKPHTLTKDERERALLMLVACGGSPQIAGDQLREEGLPVQNAQLRRLKGTVEYAKLHDEHKTEHESHIVRELRTVASEATRVQLKALARTEERLDQNIDSSPAQTASALAKTAQVAVDKLMSMTGRPQTITEHRSPHEIVRSLMALGVLKAATDEPESAPAELAK